MNKICIIAGRDFKALVSSPIFFISMGVSSLLMSFSYLRVLFSFAAQSMGMMGMGPEAANIHFGVFMNHISLSNLIFILIIPSLTMRFFAEEKKVRTYDLLLTTPISSTDIAIGKFIAALGGGLILTGLSLVYPLVTRIFVEFSVVQTLVSYLGLFLMVGVYLSVGIFASSLTESVMLAVILGWVFNLCLWFLAQGSGFFQDSTLITVFEHLSVGQHFGQFVRGTFNVGSFVFLISCIAFFVFLTQRVVESSRWR